MKKSIIYIIAMTLILASCNTTKKTQGAIIGGAVGSAAGGLLTKNNRAVGIILGAAVGGISGGLIGAYMDKAAKDIEKDLDEVADVERIGEGIVVSFDSGLLFDYDKYDLRSETRKNLNALAESLNEYNETEVKILGHTDSKGDAVYNQDLSYNRAMEVTEYLASQGVSLSRLSVLGFGETDPIATNDTQEGRQLNRRVEVVLIASDDLKSSSQSSRP